MTEDADGIVRQIKGGEVCRYQSYPTDLPTPEMPYETNPTDRAYSRQAPRSLSEIGDRGWRCGSDGRIKAEGCAE